MQNQLILRLIVKFINPNWLAIYKDGKPLITDKHNFTHICIFENQLRPPPPFSREGLELPQWMSKWRINKEWVMVDFDNFLNSNPILNNEKQLREAIVFKNDEIK